MADAVFPDVCPNCEKAAGFAIEGRNPDIVGKCANCSYLVRAEDVPAGTGGV